MGQNVIPPFYFAFSFLICLEINVSNEDYSSIVSSIYPR